MVYETGLLVGGIGIITACVAKFKCYVKKTVALTGAWVVWMPHSLTQTTKLLKQHN